jgi:hypothetical protein
VFVKPAVQASFLFTRRRYEWEQSIDEVLLYIKTPVGVRVARALVRA